MIKTNQEQPSIVQPASKFGAIKQQFEKEIAKEGARSSLVYLDDLISDIDRKKKEGNVKPASVHSKIIKPPTLKSTPEAGRRAAPASTKSMVSPRPKEARVTPRGGSSDKVHVITAQGVGDKDNVKSSPTTPRAGGNDKVHAITPQNLEDSEKGNAITPRSVGGADNAPAITPQSQGNTEPITQQPDGNGNSSARSSLDEENKLFNPIVPNESPTKLSPPPLTGKEPQQGISSSSPKHSPQPARKDSHSRLTTPPMPIQSILSATASTSLNSEAHARATYPLPSSPPTFPSPASPSPTNSPVLSPIQSTPLSPPAILSPSSPTPLSRSPSPTPNILSPTAFGRKFQPSATAKRDSLVISGPRNDAWESKRKSAPIPTTSPPLEQRDTPSPEKKENLFLERKISILHERKGSVPVERKPSIPDRKGSVPERRHEDIVGDDGAEKKQDHISDKKDELSAQPKEDTSSIKDANGLDYHQRMRKQLIDEIILTEKDYVKDLELVVKGFLHPMKALKILTPDALNIIFSNIETLVGVNTMMCADLTCQLTTADPHRFNVKVGAPFLSMSPYLKMYSSYCSNQQKALNTLETLRKANPELRQFLEDKMNDASCRGLLFTGFLIKPVQRICKYPLFIRDLLKHTPESHEDYKPLVEAEAKVNEMVLSVNEYKRAMESLQHVLELSQTIEGVEDLVSPKRKYILEFDANICEPRIDANLQKTRHIFLFSDLLLFCKQRKNKKVAYSVKGKVNLEATKMVTLAENFGKYGLEFSSEEEGTYFMFYQSQEHQEKYGKPVREAFLTLKKAALSRSMPSSLNLLH